MIRVVLNGADELSKMLKIDLQHLIIRPNSYQSVVEEGTSNLLVA